jgi:hypothetical protein
MEMTTQNQQPDAPSPPPLQQKEDAAEQGDYIWFPDHEEARSESNNLCTLQEYLLKPCVVQTNMSTYVVREWRVSIAQKHLISFSFLCNEFLFLSYPYHTIVLTWSRLSLASLTAILFVPSTMLHIYFSPSYKSMPISSPVVDSRKARRRSNSLLH